MYILIHFYYLLYSGALAHDIYIWIGSETSLDEAGTAVSIILIEF